MDVHSQVDVEDVRKKEWSLEFPELAISNLSSGIPAFPPFLKISSPASTAKGCEAETIPLVPNTTDLRLGKRSNAGSG